MNFVSVKDGSVKFDRILPGGFCILGAIESAAVACGVNLTLTCGTDSHPSTDPHWRGEAYDLSVQDLNPQKVWEVYRFLKNALGPPFTVLYEVPVTFPVTFPELARVAYRNPSATGPHLHVQVKKGTTFPPLPVSSSGKSSSSERA